jgi:hypothetical protein
MNGFWITLYNNLARSKVVGYLYCCGTTGCKVTKVTTKEELKECPKCKVKIEEEET